VDTTKKQYQTQACFFR